MLKRFVKRAMLFFNVLAIAALLLALMVGYVSPIKLPSLAVFGLAYPYLFMLNIAFVVFWIAFKKYYFVFSLAVLFLGIVRNNDFSRNKGEETEPLIKNVFTLMSYNVRVFDLYNWSNNKETRNKMFGFIREKNPGVVCFQEYFNDTDNYYSVHDSLMENQKFIDAHIKYTDVVNEHQKFGIATYSCYPIINKGVETFPSTSNLIIYSDIKINHDTVRVFNCHLQSVRFTYDDYNFMDSLSTVSEKRRIEGVKGVYGRLKKAYTLRAKQAERLSEMLEESPYPTILGGDFNDTPNSYAYQTIIGDYNDSHVVKGYGSGGTYYRFISNYRIDYILYNKKLICREFNRFKVNYSDHYPIMGKYGIAVN